MSKVGCSIYPSILRSFFTGKEDFHLKPAERSEAQEKVDNLSVIHQMLIVLNHAIAREDSFDSTGKYRKDYGQKAAMVYEIYEKYGWSFADEAEQQIIDGTSDLYIKEVLNPGNDSKENTVAFNTLAA